MGNPNWPISRSVVSAPGRFLFVLGDFSLEVGESHHFKNGWMMFKAPLLEKWWNFLHSTGPKKWWNSLGLFGLSGFRCHLGKFYGSKRWPLLGWWVKTWPEIWLHGYMTSNDKGSSCVTTWITWTNYRFFGIPPYFFGWDFCWEKQSGSKRGGERNSWEFLQLQKDVGCLLSI